MKMFVVFAALVAVCAAGLLPHGQGYQRHQSHQSHQSYQGQHSHQIHQIHQGQPAVVVKEQLHDNIGLDGYQYNYQLSDGQQREESAELKNSGTENEALVVRGSFSWVHPETNQQYTINYVADENGFHPQGAHIPV